MKEGYWVVRTYTAGQVGEKTKFWIPGERRKRSGRREREEIKKQEQNEHSAVKMLARLINANYGPGDILMGLDYSETGMERVRQKARELEADMEGEEDGEARELEAVRQAAERELRLCLRRVKRELAKDGIELTYIAVTSDMDGDTGEAVRVHHHMIVPAAAREAFVKKWKTLGGVDWEPLRAQKDYTPVAEYFLRQVRRVPDAKKYVTSRGLIRPQPKDRAVLTDAELRAPQGGTLLYRSEYKPGRPQYIRYILPEAKAGGRRAARKRE